MKTDHFGQWLDAFATDDLAKKLEVRTETIRLWRIGRGYPSVRLMKRIRKLSRGKITYAMIIDRTV